MKKFVLVLVMVFILLIVIVVFVDSGKVGSKVKNISLVEIDGSKVIVIVFFFVEIVDYDSNIIILVFVLFGKSFEGVEISIYIKKDNKEVFL